MNGIYEEASQGYDVTGATAAGIRRLVQGALGREIYLSRLGTFVEPPVGIIPGVDLFCTEESEL